MPDPKIEAAFAALEAEVTRNTEVDTSASIALVRLAELYAANKLDPAKIQAITDKVKASSDKLAADVITNTPAAEEPPPTPTP